MLALLWPLRAECRAMVYIRRSIGSFEQGDDHIEVTMQESEDRAKLRPSKRVLRIVGIQVHVSFIR